MNDNEDTGKNTSPETGSEGRGNDNTRLRSGALRSSLTIELHTRYAIQLWQGREGHEKQRGEKKNRKRNHKWRIIGMPFFLHLVTVINEASRRDDPFADERMLVLENLFARGDALVKSMVEELDGILHNLPRQISLSSVCSVSPVNIGVFSSTPVGYRCVWLLVGFDQLAMQASQAWHYGLISHTQREKYLNAAGAAVRRVFGVALGFRKTGVTRLDIVNNTPLAQEAGRLMGKVSEDVLWGRKRSSWSPPVSRRSIDALNRGYFADEDPPESHIVFEEPPEGRITATGAEDTECGDVPVQSQTQTEEATAQGVNELTDDIDTDMDDLSTLLPLSPEPE
ncbi:TIGR03761 family integrating conjugative element protein [Salmonella enterica]|nr:TIGR03761 family integrating conjugative element protein [Salmonella enterica]